MNFRRIVIIAIAVLALCAGALWTFYEIFFTSSKRMLDSIKDETVESNPEIALPALDSIDIEKLHFAADKARYTLLRTQARTKMNINNLQDTVISDALSYYRRHEKMPELMKAAYYDAFISLYTLNNFHRASYNASQALDLARRYDNYMYAGRAEDILGEIYRLLYNSERYEQCCRNAVEEYKKAGLRKNLLFALCDMGHSIAGRSPEEAVKIIQNICREAKLAGNDTLYFYCKNYESDALMRAGRLNEALTALESYIDSVPYPTDVYNDLIFRAWIHFLMGNLGEVEKSLEKIDARSLDYNNKTGYYTRLAELAYARRDIDRYKQYSDSMWVSANEALKISFNNSVDAAQKDYLEVKLKSEGEKAFADKMILIGLIGICLLAIVLIVVVVSRRRNRMIEDYEDLLTELKSKFHVRYSNLESQCDDAEFRCGQIENICEEMRSQLKTAIEKLNEAEDINAKIKLQALEKKVIEQSVDARLMEIYRQKWHDISKLCEPYFNNEKSTKVNNKFIKEFKNKLGLILNVKDIDNLEIEIDCNSNGMMTKLKDQCPELTKEDLRLVVIVVAGISAVVGSVFLKISKQNFYTRKSRCKRIIENSDAPDKHLFLSFF